MTKPKYYIYPNKKPKQNEVYLVYVGLGEYPEALLNGHQEYECRMVLGHDEYISGWFWRYP